MEIILHVFTQNIQFFITFEIIDCCGQTFIYYKNPILIVWFCFSFFAFNVNWLIFIFITAIHYCPVKVDK